MLFSSGPQIVLYLTTDSLQFYQKGVENSQTLVFPKEAVSKLQLKDKPKLEDALVDFLLNLKVKKQKVVFILSGEAVEKKTFPTTEEDVEGKIVAFLKKLPYGENQIAHKKFEQGSEIEVIAINKDILECVGDVFEKMGWEIISVVPDDMVGIAKSSALTSEEVDTALKNYSDAKKADFIYADTDQPRLDRGQSSEIKIEKQPKSDGSLLMTLILIAVMLGLIAGGVLLGSKYFGLSFLNFSQPAKPTPTPVTQPAEKEASPSAEMTVSTAEKEALNIQVLNGSGVKGQAATVKEILEALGYKQIDTGNAEETDLTETTLVFSKNVSLGIQTEIMDELKKTFAEVTSVDSENAGTFDIVITTGKSL